MYLTIANITDLSDLIDLRIAYLLDDYGNISEETLTSIKASLPEYFKTHLNKDLIAFVCKEQNKIAGCCFLYISEKPANPCFITGKTGMILNVYTRPEFRRKGIASKLLKMLLNEAEKHKLDYVELNSTDAAYKLYKTLGFQDHTSKYHEMRYNLK